MRRSGQDNVFRCALCLACLFFPALGQAQFRNGPPWHHPVASSQSFQIGGSTIQVDVGPGLLDLPKDQILQWVHHAATAVATYYGHFPVSRDRILLEPVAGERGILQGTTWGDVGGSPAFTRIRIGQHTTLGDLDEDWEMTHEMVHTAFPSLDDKYSWMEEGLATYIEPIARVQSGFLSPERIWSDMQRDMPKGDPGIGDRGLNNTHTWGRTYWGGAQFCLLADVAIREATGNRQGLQDALRAIVQAGGTIDKSDDQDWPLRKALAIGDQATGTHVLIQLYDSMADTPKTIDLAGLWTKLGVARSGDGVRFDPKAPEAAIREAITKSR